MVSVSALHWSVTKFCANSSGPLYINVQVADPVHHEDGRSITVILVPKFQAPEKDFRAALRTYPVLAQAQNSCQWWTGL